MQPRVTDDVERELRIAVALTTCDSADYLEAQLSSIVRQTRLPDVVVVGDDCSIDSTPSILAEFSRRVPFPVHVLHHSERLGPIGNTDAVYARCVGLADVVAIADHDDVWAREKLAVVEEAFRATPSPTVWFSDATLIDGEGEMLGQSLFEMVHLEEAGRDQLRTGGGLRRLVHGETVTNPTMAVSAELARICLPFPEECVLGRRVFQQDGWAAVLGRILGEIAIDDRALIAYRRHGHSVSHGERLQSAQATQFGRRADLEREQRRARLVADRVGERDAAWHSGRRHEIVALDAFLTARVERRGILRRLAGIGRALRHGWYHRFAQGTRTVLYDVADTFRVIS
jgi:glycosyltransferase involved in cell wall biosynthesis